MFSTPEMDAIFSPTAHVQAMLRFEGALARAEAATGVIPAEAADAITAACHVESFDVAAIFSASAVAGTPAIPLVQMLTARVAGNASHFVHWGATSQDAIDTALMLQMRDGLDVLIADLLHLCDGGARLAEHHRATVMAGRTLLQQALPITFGLKAARWLAVTTRQVQALRDQRSQSLALQFGGAAGTLAALGDAGLRVAEHLAQELQLPLPVLPWHAERDRVAEIAATVGIVAGSVAKIASDIALLAQTEVGEVAEQAEAGKGGSSAMPHKRNPLDAMTALASVRLAAGVVSVVLSALVQEHERAVGGWQAEWTAIPALFRHTASVITHVERAVRGLQVNTQQMRANLDCSNGLFMAEAVTMTLAPHVGRQAAHRLVEAACQCAVTTGGPLRAALLNDEQVCSIVSPAELDRALDPGAYLGSANGFIDRALAAYRDVQQR